MADDDPVPDEDLERLLRASDAQPDRRAGWRKVHEAVGTPLLVVVLVGAALILVSGIALVLGVVAGLAE